MPGHRARRRRAPALALLALACGLTAAPPAAAVPRNPTVMTQPGTGCAFVAARDTTPGTHLGGANTWHGVVTALFAQPVGGVDSFGPVYCYLIVNGVNQGVVLAADDTTVEGAVVAAEELSFFAEDADVVTLCDVMWVNGTAVRPHCEDAQTAPVVPQPLYDLAVTVADAASGAARPVADPVLCPVIGALAPGIPTLVDVSPEGDVTVAGSREWDCPPYGP